MLPPSDDNPASKSSDKPIPRLRDEGVANDPHPAGNVDQQQHTVVHKTSLWGFHHPVRAVVVSNSTGQRCVWNARDHRKLRYPEPLAGDGKESGAARRGPLCRFHVVSWEPRIVTWYICWIGFIANTLWVVNGVYATWGESIDQQSAALISYITGVIGAFLFIVTGYLGVVEVINHNHTTVELPAGGNSASVQPRAFRPVRKFYGTHPSPLGGHKVDDEITRTALQKSGYPIVIDRETGRVLIEEQLQGFVQSNASQVVGHEGMERHLDIHLGNKVIHAVATGAYTENAEREPAAGDGYLWWTWAPDFSHVSVVAAYLFFACTIVFFIPAVIWWPVDEAGNASTGVVVFFVDVLQVLPSIGFIIVGHMGMAEVAASWCKTRFTSIGYNVAFFNALGGYGFFLCGLLAIPTSVDPSCCAGLYQWGSALSTFWGSCFFWIAGVLQCIEFSNQHPLQVGR